MANKVASKRWIYSNFSVGSSSNECATKTEILGFGLYITNDSSYASNQLVREEDIYLPAWTYSFSVSNWDKNVGESGGTTSSISISSSKSRLGTTESVGWSIDSSTVPSWITWNSSSMTFTVASNSSTSSRTANIYFEQDESGKRDYARVTQAGHTQVTTYNYVFWTSTSGGTSTSGSFGQSGSSIQPQIYSYRETIVDGTVTSRDAISFSYTDKPSWITGEAVSTGYNPPNSPTYYAKMTASENTSVDARSYDVVITQSGSDKEITISVSQPGKANEYTFEIRKSDEEYTGKTSITFDVPASTVGWSGNYAYRSRKNGEQFANVSFSSSASWLHVESSGTYTVDHNTGSSSRSGTITLTQAESGLKCYVYINQSGYTPTYTFNVSPTNLSVTAAETNETLTVNSYKTVLESDGSETTESLDYEFSSDASWVNAARTTTNTTYITIAENLTTVKRNAKITLTQAESGLKCYVYINQSGYTPTYTFNVSPTNLSVTAAETNETLTVNSYKTVLESDGSETTESLDYEFSSDASWVNAARTTTNTTYITIAENLTVAKRNAKITLTQAESGAQAFTNVTQAGKVQSSNKLTITSITYDEAYLFPPGVTPVVGSAMYLKFLIPNTFTWETSSGLTMNRGTAYAGDTCNIYVFENSRYKLVRSFTLQTGEQTIAI